MVEKHFLTHDELSHSASTMIRQGDNAVIDGDYLAASIFYLSVSHTCLALDYLEIAQTYATKARVCSDMVTKVQPLL